MRAVLADVNAPRIKQDNRRIDLDIPPLLEAASRTFPGRLAVEGLDQLDGSRSPYDSAMDLQRLRERARCVAHLLTRLRLAPGAPVAVVLPNCPEAMITLHGILMAGYSPLFLPVTMSEEDVRVALERNAVPALITVTNIGTLKPAEAMRQVAARYFGLRFLMAFGDTPPDGVLSLDRLPEAPETLSERPLDAAHILTYDQQTKECVVRTGEDLIAAGLSVAATAAIKPGHRIISLLAPDDLTGIVTGPVLSLVAGATLQTLAQFNSEHLIAALEDKQRVHIIAPAWLEPALVASDLMALPWVVSVMFVHNTPWTWQSRGDYDPSGVYNTKLIDLLNVADEAVFVAPRIETVNGGWPIDQVVPKLSTGVMLVSARTMNGQLEIRGRGAVLKRMRGFSPTEVWSRDPHEWRTTALQAHVVDGYIHRIEFSRRRDT
jgi:mycobactin salicyl-AMP ligase